MGYPSTTNFIPQLDPVVTEIGAVKKTINVAASKVLVRGTIMAQLTSGKQFVAYNHANSDGSQYAVGILAQNVDTTTNGANAQEADMYTKGSFWYDRLTGADAYFAGLFSSFRQQQITYLNILNL